MISKIGSNLIKEALYGTIMGGVKAGDLTPDERKALQKEYGFDESARLGTRNVLRGLAGDIGGGVAGSLIGNQVLKHIYKNNPVQLLMDMENPFHARSKRFLGPLIGMTLGGSLMSNKYSPEKARKIIYKDDEDTFGGTFMGDKEKAALKKHYDIKSDLEFQARASGRELLGDLLGSTPRSIFAVKGALKGNVPRVAVGTLASVIGGRLGRSLAEEKYSPQKADEVIKKRDKGK